MAGGALLVVTLTHRTGRRLRRKRLGTRGSGHEHESNQHHRYPDHDPPFAGIRPVPPLEKLISYFTRTVGALRPFPRCCATIVCRCVVRPQHRSADALARWPDAGIHLGRQAFSARACQQGRLAQLVERLLYTQKVGGSRPSPPTNLRSLRKLRVAQLSGRGIESRRNRRIGLGIFSDRTISSRKLAKQNARRRGNLLRRRTGGERREIPNFESLLGGDQIASLSSFEARKATFLLALI